MYTEIAMMPRNDWFDDFQKNMSDLIAKSPAADIERNVRALMAQTFSRLDLVTREEFDVQAQLLERALARITTLESRVQAIENRPDTPLQPRSTEPLEPSTDPTMP
jgi:BMFP domain-containing protein YqiC